MIDPAAYVPRERLRDQVEVVDLGAGRFELSTRVDVDDVARVVLRQVVEDHAELVELAIERLKLSDRVEIERLRSHVDRRLKAIALDAFDRHQRTVGPWYLRGDAGLADYQSATHNDARRVLVGPAPSSTHRPAR